MTKSKFFIIFLFLISLRFSSQAQLVRVIHQTFELDDYDNLALNIAGDLQIEKWAGNTIMTETKVKLYDASPGIINYFVKEGRYEIETEIKAEAITLLSKDMERRPIKTKTGECYEEVKVRLFLPEDFEQQGSSNWKRVIPVEEDINPPTAARSDSTSVQKNEIPVQQDSLIVQQDSLIVKQDSLITSIDSLLVPQDSLKNKE